jgi:acyl dehydratase
MRFWMQIAEGGAHLVWLAWLPRVSSSSTVIKGDDGVTQRNEAWPNAMPEIGQRAQRSRAVTARDIELFTEISGDRNPLHFDEEAARATRFGGIVVQGGVISAILNAAVAEEMPGPGTVFLQVNWSFKSPVRPGDTITGEVQVTKVRPDKPIAELETAVLQGDGTLLLDGNAVCYTMPIQNGPEGKS